MKILLLQKNIDTNWKENIIFQSHVVNSFKSKKSLFNSLKLIHSNIWSSLIHLNHFYIILYIFIYDIVEVTSQITYRNRNMAVLYLDSPCVFFLNITNSMKSLALQRLRKKKLAFKILLLPKNVNIIVKNRIFVG